MSGGKFGYLYQVEFYPEGKLGELIQNLKKFVGEVGKDFLGETLPELRGMEQHYVNPMLVWLGESKRVLGLLEEIQTIFSDVYKLPEGRLQGFWEMLEKYYSGDLGLDQVLEYLKKYPEPLKLKMVDDVG